MNPLCIALSVRTDFSIGESSLQVPRLVELAQAQGYSHVALCDLMSVSAMPLFVEKAKKAGITPLIGATLHLVDDPTARIKDKDGNNPVRIKAFPTSERGMRSLFRTLSLALTPERFYYHGRLSLDDVLQLEDVLVTTGDVRSLWHHPNAEDLASRLHARFGDALWVEFSAQDTPLFDQLNRRAAKWAADREVNRLVSRPVYYATDEDADSTDVLRAIVSNTEINSKWLARPWLRDLSLCAPRDMAAHCKALVERVPEVGPARALLDGVAVFAERCTYRFEKQPPCLPKMADNEFAALVKACTEGWKERFTRQVWGHMPTPEELVTTYKERLRYELEVIKKMGFSGYFLLVQDIVRWAKANKVMVGPGRGSCFLAGHRVILDKSGLTREIENIKIGDTVLAHDGTTQTVIDTLQFDRDEEIIDLEFDNGVRISCTKDHLFFTKNRGWVAAEDISEEDEFDDVRELARRLEPKAPSSAG